jgi:hypothetical protein
MTGDKDFIGQLEAYLDDYEGMTPLPGSVRDSVRAALPSTRQLGPISGPVRDIYMNSSMDTPARWGLVAAVVIGAVIIGGALIFGGGGVGNEPSPTPSPSVAPSESAVPSGAEPVDIAAVAEGTQLTPGDYYFSNIPGVQVVFTVGTGWERNVPDNVVWTIEDEKAAIGATAIENLYVDPCQPELGLLDPAVGPTVDDLVTALEAVPGLTFSDPIPIDQDGADGVRIDYVPPDEFGDCLGQGETGDILLGTAPGGGDVYAPSGASPVIYYIFDVDGTRVVISEHPNPGSTTDVGAVLLTIRFE